MPSNISALQFKVLEIHEYGFENERMPLDKEQKEYIKNKLSILGDAVHIIDDNYNEFTQYISNVDELSKSMDLYWVNENCLSIPIKFSSKNKKQYYRCKLVLEKIDKILYDYEYSFNNEPIDNKKYIQINAKSGVWCRKGIGFKYSKYKAIPWGTKCELVEKNVGTANGYKWDKIIYNGVTVYLPNNWNKYL